MHWRTLPRRSDERLRLSSVKTWQARLRRACHLVRKIWSCFEGSERAARPSRAAGRCSSSN